MLPWCSGGAASVGSPAWSPSLRSLASGTRSSAHEILAEAYAPAVAFQSTESVLAELARTFARDVTELRRCLANSGCAAAYAQTPRDEYPMCVGDLAADLRDGVRLT